MIYDFSISNFKSFPDGFRFVANRTPESESNSVSMIMGKNNAGKTNLLEAFWFLRRIILKEQLIDSSIKDYLNKDSIEPKILDISIRIDLEFKEKIYEYCYKLSINLADVSIISEYLDVTGDEHHVLIDGEKRRRILRAIDSKHVLINTDTKQTMFSFMFGNLPWSGDSDLIHFYNTGARSSFEKTVGLIILFIMHFQNLRILSPKLDLVAHSEPEPMVDLLNSLDLGMRFLIVDENLENNRFLETALSSKSQDEINRIKSGQIEKAMYCDDGEMRHYIKIKHNRTRIYHIEIQTDMGCIPLRNEYLSEGIRRLIGLAFIICNNYHNETILVDELDRKLHTNLSLKMIELFKSKRNRNQLIFTTHETEFLNSDVIDVDNIWIIDKSQGIGSYLYSCPHVLVERDLKQMYIDDKLI